MNDEKVFEVMTSQAMGKIANLAKNVALDVNNKGKLKSMLSTLLVDLTIALDHDRIHFDNIEDEALFHDLLACCLQQIFDGEELKVDLMTRQ